MYNFLSFRHENLYEITADEIDNKITNIVKLLSYGYQKIYIFFPTVK